VSEAAVYTISIFSDGVYIGAGIEVTEAAVVEGTAVIGTGVETIIVVVGCVVTAVAGGIVVDCDVVQPATRHANSRRQTTLMNTEYLSFHRLCMIDQSFLYRICAIYDKLFYLIFCKS
jgi:hypothetical protein